MPRGRWTQEQKDAASAREKARRAGQPVPGGNVVSEEESFMARMRGGATTTREDAAELTGEQALGQDNSVQVEHKSNGTAVLYRPETWGWRPVKIPRSSIPMLLSSGWRISCGDCDGQHDEIPNSCPGREPLLYRVCPQPSCGKRFYDIDVVDESEESGDLDLARIVDEKSQPTTPAGRTLARMNQHIRAFHEGLAYERGLMSASAVMAGV